MSIRDLKYETTTISESTGAVIYDNTALGGGSNNINYVYYKPLNSSPILVWVSSVTLYLDDGMSNVDMSSWISDRNTLSASNIKLVNLASQVVGQLNFTNTTQPNFDSTVNVELYNEAGAEIQGFGGTLGVAGTPAIALYRPIKIINSGWIRGGGGSGGQGGRGADALATPSLTNTDVFTSNGTWTAPKNVTSAYIDIIGGGGSGAATSYNTNSMSGGGNRGYWTKTWKSVIPETSYPVTIGVGGAKVRANDGTRHINGLPGTASSVGTLITAAGGAGGIKTYGTGPYDIYGEHRNITPYTYRGGWGRDLGNGIWKYVAWHGQHGRNNVGGGDSTTYGGDGEGYADSAIVNSGGGGGGIIGTSTSGSRSGAGGSGYVSIKWTRPETPGGQGGTGGSGGVGQGFGQTLTIGQGGAAGTFNGFTTGGTGGNGGNGGNWGQDGQVGTSGNLASDGNSTNINLGLNTGRSISGRAVLNWSLHGVSGSVLGNLSGSTS